MKLLSFLQKLFVVDIDGDNKYWKIRQKWEHSSGLLKKHYNNKWRKLMVRFHSYIPLTVDLDRSVVFPHGISNIYISRGAHIGKDCVIFQQVTVGSNTLTDSNRKGAPTIKNNCYIGAGATIIGRVQIGSNVRIGANCVVAQDIDDNSTVVMQKPVIIKHDTVKDNSYLNWEFT